MSKMKLKRNTLGALMPLLLGGNAVASVSSVRRNAAVHNPGKIVIQQQNRAESNSSFDVRPFDVFTTKQELTHSPLFGKAAEQKALNTVTLTSACKDNDELIMHDCSVSGDDNISSVESKAQMKALHEAFISELSDGKELNSPDNRYHVSEVVVLDPQVTGVESLLQGLNPEIMVLRLSPDEDGVESLKTLLEPLQGIKRLHFVSHGSNGLLNIGNTQLSSSNLTHYQAQFASIAQAFADEATINLYGCSVAANEQGKAFVAELQTHLGVSAIAASEDLTGPEQLGGDWELEHTSGDVIANVPFSQQAMQEANFVLANCTIDSGFIFHPFLADGALSVGQVSLSGTSVSQGAFYVTATNSSNLLPAGGGVASVDITGLTVAQVTGHPLCTKVTLPAFNAPLDDGSESVNILDDSSNGDSVFDVDGNDGNGGITDANVTYDFIEDNFNPNSDGDSDGNALFTINSSTGVITVNDSDDLVAGESYALSVRIQDGDINKSTVQATVTVSINSAADTTAPNNDSAPSVAAENDTSITVNVDLDEAGTVYGVAVASGASAPSSAQVKAGNDASDSAAISSASKAVTAAADTLVLTGLTASTAYDLYIVAEDDESPANLQASPVKLSQTTSAAPTPPVVDNIDDIGTAEDAPFNLSISGTDVNGDALTFRLKTGSPSWLSVVSGSESVSTFAGNGNDGFAGDGGDATLAEFSSPFDMVFDSNGNLYIADTNNNRARKIDTNGVISTFAGVGSVGQSSGDGGLATAAGIVNPYHLAVDSHDNLYILDKAQSLVRKVDVSTGTITTVAGSATIDTGVSGAFNGVKGFGGDGNAATSTNALVASDITTGLLDEPNGIAIDGNDNLYIADTNNHRIRKVDADTGIITTIAGTGGDGLTGDGGLASAAEIGSPESVKFDSNGDLFIVYSGQHGVRKIDMSTGIISTVAGTGSSGFSGDGGLATSAQFNSPFDIAFDADGNFYIADTFNNRIRQVMAADDIITTWLGDGTQDSAGDGGDRAGAHVNLPVALAFDSAGALYVLEAGGNRIRKITAAGIKLTGTPTNDDVGDHNVCIIANDGTDDSAEECFTLTVTNVNDAPVATAQSISTIENTAQAITLAGTDVDNDDNSLTFSVVGQPSNGQLTGSGSNLTYTPDSNFTGNDSFTFKANDGALDSANATVSITVTEQPKLEYSSARADISEASYDSASFDISAEESSAQGLTFNNDGTALYVIGMNSDKVHQYSLSSAYDIATVNYDNVEFLLSSQDDQPTDIAFNDDGSKMYLVGFSSQTVYEYNLSTPYDLSTASYNNVSFSVAAQDTLPFDITFNANGSKFYITGDSNNAVYQYSLSSVYDISTASYDNVSLSTTSRTPAPRGAAFNSDGTRLYVSGSARVYQYNLSVAYDVSSATYDSVLNVSSQESDPRSITFKPDIEKLFVLGRNNIIYQYSVPGELYENDGSAGAGAIIGDLTISITGDTFVNSSGTLTSPTHFTINNLPAGLTATLQISADGKTATLVFSGNATASQLSDSIADLQFTFTDAAFTGGDASAINNSVNANSGVGINFSNDTTAPTLAVVTPIATPTFDNMPSFTFSSDEAGTLAVGGSCGTSSSTAVTVGNNTITLAATDNSSALSIGVYSNCTVTVTDAIGNASSVLSIADFEIQSPELTYTTPEVDISGTSYDNLLFSINNEDSAPLDLAFNLDGSKLFVVGQENDSVYQYSLSTAYEINTASYDNVSFSLAGQETSPSSIVFNPLGTKLFVIGYDSDAVHEYDLSTPYDLSTASYNNVYVDVSGQTTEPRAITLNHDGTKLYVAATSASNTVHQYSLSTAYDMSMVSYDNVVLNAGAQEDQATGLRFNKDGSKLFILGLSSTEISQYSLSTPYDINTAQYDNKSFSVSSQAPAPFGFVFDVYHSSVFVLGPSSRSVHQYSMSIRGISERNRKAGSGEVTGNITITVSGDTFVNASGTLTSPTHFTINNLPAGLTAAMDVDCTGDNATLVLTGSVSPSQINDSIEDLQFTFTNAAFTGGDVSAITNSTNANSDIGITFSNDTTKPVANDQSVVTNESTAKPITLSATDANSDDSQLVYSVVSQPINGQLSGTAPNLTYTPNASFTGNDSFTFKANDSSVDSDPATVSITVNAAPVVVSLSDISLDENGSVNLNLTGQSASGQPLSFRLKSGAPSWLNIASVVAGEVTTIAGLAGTSGGTDANGTNARFNFPYDGVVDSQNNIYVVDTLSNKIRKITPSGDVTTFAGSGTPGDANGSGVNASFDLPLGIAIDNNDNLYIADAGNHLIRKITPAGEVTTLAGTSGSDGDDDGTGNLAKFNDPNNLVVASDGNIYVTDRGNHTIRKITPAGEVSTFAGDSGSPDSTDGNGSSARFNFPTGITFTADHLYVTEQGSHLIRKISLTGDATTFAGQVDTMGSEDGNGVNASFNVPTGITADSDNNLYVTDRENQLIRKISPSGDVTTLAGSLGVSGSADGNGTAAQFNRPSGLVTDSQNNVYVIDQNNHVIRKISAAKNTLTGTPSSSDAGQYTICIIANDGISDSAEQCFSLTVNGNSVPEPTPDPIPTANSAPVIGQGTSQQGTTLEDTNLSISLTATDADNDSLSWSISSQASNGSASVSGGSVSYTPSANFNGNDSFEVQVSDGSVTDSIIINVTVTAVNDAPTLSGSPATTVKTGENYQFIPIAQDLDGDELTFSANGLPSWLGLDTNTGALTGTPTANDVGIYEGISVAVSDGSSSTSLASFTIEVISDNSAPVLSGESLTTEEDMSVSAVLPQQDSDEDNLVYSVVTEPENGSVEFTAAGLTYTPNANFNGADSFSVQANDGELNSNVANFTVAVSALNDAPIAEDDAFTFDRFNNDVYTLDVLSNDSDVEGDVLSIAIANASIGNVTVTNNQLNYQAPDNFVGTVELGYSINDGKDGADSALASLTISGSANQTIELTAPPAVTVDATGLFTSVDLGVATAFDSQGTPLPVSLVDSGSILPPGRHIVYWRAGEGETQVTAEQQVNVVPLVSIGKDETVTEGSSIAIPVILNGDSPIYPLTISYTVSGTANNADHTLSNGSVTFVQGREQTIHFEVLVDDEVESEESIVITLDSSANLGANNRSTITVSEQNIAPEISLTVTQSGEERLTVAQDQGEVRVAGLVTDANPQDQVTTQWLASGLTNTSDADESFVFDPSAVDEGIYQVSLFASDNGSPESTNTSSVFIAVTATLAVLSDSQDTDGDLIPDSQEGYADEDGDGIPDFQDAISDCNVVPERAAVQTQFLVEGEPGVCMRRGSIAALSDSDGVEVLAAVTNSASSRQSRLNEQRVSMATVPNDDEVTRIGRVIDFILYGLPEEGASYEVALPQNTPLSSGAVYRKYSAEKGWFTFIEDAHNKLFSSQGEKGYCPPPGGDVWQPGLNEGHWCVQLLIQDGGPNDNDGEVNGSISDPGVIAILAAQNQPPTVQDDTAQTRINTAVTFSVLNNDSDVDNDALTVTSVTAEFGDAVVNQDQSVTYTPEDRFVGQDTLIYGVNDGNGGSNSATVTITVNPNQLPVLADDAVTVIEGQSVTIDVLANDSDADGDSLTVINATVTTGTVTINADQTLTYTSVEGQLGNVQIQYQVNDGFDTLSALATVTVQAKPFESVTTKNKGGGSIGWLMLLALIMLGALRPSLKPVKE